MTDIENTLRTFNIDRPDIQEAVSHGASKTIAVPADRYKQYYDTIKAQQALLQEALKALSNMRHLNFADGEHTKCVLAYDEQHAQSIALRLKPTTKYNITTHGQLRDFKLGPLLYRLEEMVTAKGEQTNE